MTLPPTSTAPLRALHAAGGSTQAQPFFVEDGRIIVTDDAACDDPACGTDHCIGCGGEWSTVTRDTGDDRFCVACEVIVHVTAGRIEAARLATEEESDGPR